MDAPRLLDCARTYHDTKPAATALGERFASVEEAVRRLIDTTLVDAHEAFTAARDFDPAAHLHLHAVDLETPSPGILEVQGNKALCTRAEGYTPVDYVWRPQHATPAVPIAQMRRVRAPETAVRRGRARMVARDSGTGRKAQGKKMTEKTEGGAGVLTEAEEAVAQAEAPEAPEAEALKSEAPKTEAPETEAPEGAEELLSTQEESSPEGSQSEQSVARRTAQRAKRAAALMDEACEPDRSRRWSRRKARTAVRHARVYDTPVTFDRFLRALTRCDPSPALLPALLRAEPTDAVRVFCGPPGTGKTHALVQRCAELPADERVVVLHPSNVGACHLYARLHLAGVRCALIVPSGRVAPDTPRFPGRDEERARVVVATVSGRHSPRLIGHGFEHVLLDEAGQVPEAQVWGLLDARVRSLELFGDLRQLPGVTGASAKALRGDVSLMQRLLDLDYPAARALVQRRMHPEILRFPNLAYYDGELGSEYQAPEHGPEPYAYVVVRGAETAAGTSVRNDAEADEAVRQAHALRERFDDVVVLTGYAAQAEALASRAGVPVHTVDSFQGREADACVISLVRTRAPGFWADPRRLNVALTRARHALRVVGAKHEGDHPLGALFADAVARGKVV